MKPTQAQIIKKKHGGKRKGAGRPKSEPYKKVNIAVPISQIKRMKKHKLEPKSKPYVDAMNEKLDRITGVSE